MPPSCSLYQEEMIAQYNQITVDIFRMDTQPLSGYLTGWPVTYNQKTRCVTGQEPPAPP